LKKPVEGSRLAIFRFDANPAIGGGHAIRCLTFIKTLNAEGWRCKIVTTDTSIEALRDFSSDGSEIVTIPQSASREIGPLLATHTEGCELLVIDHYDWSTTQESRCRAWARRLFVMDDLHDRSHDCDFLLDPGIDRTPEDYARLVADNCHLLLNPGYALIRQEFTMHRLMQPAVSPRDKPRNLFLNFGLLDTGNLTERTLVALEKIKFGGNLDIVMGAASPHLDRVRRYLAISTLRSVLHINPINLVELMSRADLAIGAAGGSVWERCCLGLPSLVLIAAQNQSFNARALAEVGACDWVTADDAGALATYLASLLEQPDRLGEMAAAARRLTDGLGARRAMIAVTPEKTRHGGEVGLRRTTLADAELMLQWQRHPLTRRYARNAQVPESTEHRKWLNHKLQDPACVFNIIEYQNKPAGVLRLDRVRDFAFEVSIYLDPDQTGRGIGHAALGAARRLLPEAILLAHVLAENKASYALFQAAGYRLEGDLYVKHPDVGSHPKDSSGSVFLKPSH
jgi:UDP-2,4-diacetamido-2,4,6-trideoxy-beta-L-altropyranose hydrolase